LTLPERILALHHALARHGIPHAVGGAIALAYWTLDPRATSDIDLNVFVPAEESAGVFAALPDGIARPSGVEATVRRDGQVRVWWDETPVDLFFDYAPIHAEAARHVSEVPFSGETIPVLAADELAVFKAMFDRTRDWADLEALITAGTVDLAVVRHALAGMLPEGDERFARLDEAERRAARQS
jgi:hypothetical protein